MINKKKKKICKICIILIIFLLIMLILFIIDNNRINNNKTPLFCVKINEEKQNEIHIQYYYGFGYKVTKCSIFSEQYNKYIEKSIIENCFSKGASNIKYLIAKTSIDTISVNIGNPYAKAIYIILKSLDYNGLPCAGFSQYKILNNGDSYYLKSDCKAVVKNGKEAEISEEEMDFIMNIVNSTVENNM